LRLLWARARFLGEIGSHRLLSIGLQVLDMLAWIPVQVLLTIWQWRYPLFPRWETHRSHSQKYFILNKLEMYGQLCFGGIYLSCCAWRWRPAWQSSFSCWVRKACYSDIV